MNKIGALITVFLTAVILFALFHRIILNANQVSFASGGDGIKSTFGTVYHIKHDSAYWHTGSMNYPFGESVFFTGNQVVLTNCLKLLKDAGWDLSDVVLGISNILILLSFVIASLFIYLIFIELGVVWWLSVPASVIIIILSNQWERLGGHYNLAYAYVIPVILYLLLRFYRKPGYLISVIFGVLVILFSAKQLYIAAFILILWVPYWIFLPIHDRERFGKPGFLLSHLLIQFIIPFAAYMIFTGMHDPGLDRTAYPWGFYPSRVRLDAVFLPLGFPHGRWYDPDGPVRMKAYVGLLGTVVAAIILMSVFIRLFKGKRWNALAVTGHQGWNILFWASVLGLLLALGLPFSPSWERLLNYTGPFRQLRAVGRFVFPFYYVMAITSFWYLWRWFSRNRTTLRTVFLVAVLLFAGYEAFWNIRYYPRMYYNPAKWFSGRYSLPEDTWYNRHDFEKYQAIFPLPYFHVGSENYWIGDNSPVQKDAYAAAIRTGLPLNAVMLSRTSISQTLMNLDFVLEPYHDYPLLRGLPNQKPYLLIVHKKGGLTPYEKGLISKAEQVDENENLRIYTLETDSIRSLTGDRRSELMSLAADTSSACSQKIVYEDFSSLEGGVFSGEFKRPVTFFEAVIPDSGNVLVSFWFEGADRDLWPRTNFWTELYAEDGSRYRYLYTDFFRQMVLREGSRGLIEYPVHVERPNTTIRITMRNKVVTKGEMVVERVLVRPEGCTHLLREDTQIRVNNRVLHPE